MARTYSELMTLSTFKERFDYLRIGGARSMERFYEDRKRNQWFYHSKKWKRTRDSIIVRDHGQDLAMPGWEIHGKIMVHHMNPITIEDLMNYADSLCDPENLITASFHTHNAIHYAELYLPEILREDRKPNDTCPWKEG